MGLNCIKPWTANAHSKRGGDGTQVSLSHDAYLFMAGRHSEVEKWMKAFSHMKWVPFTGVFGQTLENTILYERRHGEHAAPVIVEQCVNFIRSWGLHEVGLFRQPGQPSLIKELQEAFDAGEKLTFDSTIDVHTVASLLKLYLQKLPEPVVPFSKYADLLACANLMAEDEEKGIVELKKQLTGLPAINLSLLLYICRFLHEVQSHSTVNKMDVQNLASVFGPNILRPKLEEATETNGGTALVQQLMSVMISDHCKLFPSEDVSHAPPAADGAPRSGLACSFHSLRSEERLRESRTKSLSLPLAAKAPAQDAASLSWGPRHEHGDSCQSRGPENNKSRRKQVPSHDLRTLVHQSHCRELARDVPPPVPHLLLEEFEGEIRPAATENGQSPTIPNVSDSCGAEQKPGVAEKSTPSFSCESKLSMYDNMHFPPLPSTREARSAADRDSWSSSPCENMLEERSSSRHSSRSSCTEATLGGNLATPTCGEPLEAPGFGTVSHSNSNNSDVFLPSSDTSANQNSLQGLIAGLKHQIANQKTDYEAKIQRLEQLNNKLELEIKDLHSNLDQQRKCYDIGEIKMRNAERARRDAERRNEMLQREMEQFFDTFGELTSESKRADCTEKNF
ncbi:rho GTPase-activating protein 24-like [Ambystoma mexicanum]|uniref:rho GTPase-activating protein 24-like n=1 Tax=Ambystoma mexicanum TaxID=8296 RepID=UPI0037E7FCBF